MRFWSRLYRGKFALSLTVGENYEHEYFRAKDSGIFSWDLNPSIEISPGAALDICWKAETGSMPSAADQRRRVKTKHGPKQTIEIVVPYEDITRCVSSAIGGAAVHKCEHELASCWITFTTNDMHKLESKNVEDAIEMAGRRWSVLDRLAKSEVLLETVIKYWERHA